MWTAVGAGLSVSSDTDLLTCRARAGVTQLDHQHYSAKHMTNTSES